ncbi:unnamed protein product [Rhizoctonia solani]|uniref:Uncharacterized protein n=1 Tax=Rhizoctonia solani TaxID=456999 RepID=A0A8H2WN20_9AGAM|nr:unnamed protein product [Rhizoctonia solani]
MGALSKRKRTAKSNLKKAREQCFRNRAERHTNFLRGNGFVQAEQQTYSTDIGPGGEHILQEPYVPNVILWDDCGIAISELVENNEDVSGPSSPSHYGAISEDINTPSYEDNILPSTFIEGIPPEGLSVNDLGLQCSYSDSEQKDSTILDPEDRTKYTISSAKPCGVKQPIREASTSYLRNYKEIFRASKKAIAATQALPTAEESWVIEGISLEEILHTYGRRLDKKEPSERQSDTAPGRYLVIKLD